MTLTEDEQQALMIAISHLTIYGIGPEAHDARMILHEMLENDRAEQQLRRDRGEY